MRLESKTMFKGNQVLLIQNNRRLVFLIIIVMVKYLLRYFEDGGCWLCWYVFSSFNEFSWWLGKLKGTAILVISLNYSNSTFNNDRPIKRFLPNPDYAGHQPFGVCNADLFSVREKD